MLCSLCILLSSCKDDFDINTLGASPKMVVYCFPSTADTTYINITKSIPVQNKKIWTSIQTVDNAHILYKVNGEERQACFKSGGVYYVVGKHNAGDRIELAISADSLPSISASTMIPESCDIDSFDIKAVEEFNNDDYDTEYYWQLKPTFTDKAGTKDYYAVTAGLRCYRGYGVGYDKDMNIIHRTDVYDETDNGIDKWFITDSVTYHSEIITNDEPLLKPLTDIDSDFGFKDKFYQDFYIFNDNTINGETYTMRLNVKYNDNVVNYIFMKKRGVELYKITPEYYNFIKSLNDVENNGMAEVGLSQITPTCTNIKGGLGVLGAYNKTYSKWIRIR